MEGLAEERREVPVFLGVDTHSEAHVAVALDRTGRRVGELTVANSEAGYAELVGWALGLGTPG
jgi:transposase